MANAHTYTAATAVLTLTDNFDDTETCTIASKVYTIRATPVADGDVDLGTDAEGTLKNLLAAINLDPTAGETGTAGDYDTAMTENPEVVCSGSTATTLTVVSKAPGTVGNFIDCTETHGEGSWDNAVLSGGVGDLESWVKSELLLNQLTSEVISDLRTLTPDAD